jgi:hypothetical protein
MTKFERWVQAVLLMVWSYGSYKAWLELDTEVWSSVGLYAAALFFALSHLESLTENRLSLGHKVSWGIGIFLFFVAMGLKYGFGA